jgi:hypothetical protein
MADVRVQQPIKIVDPTTNSQEAGVDASGNLQVILASNTGVDVGDVDVTSVIPGTGATNLGKAQDAVVGGTDTGVAILAMRDDALGGITPAELDYSVLHVDANGALWTHDDALDAALAGNELQVDVVAALPTGANTIGEVTIGAATTAAGDLAKAEDVAHVTGDVGVMSLAVRQDTATILSGTDGDYTPLIVDASGRLHVTDPNAGAGSPSTPTRDQASTTLAAGVASTTEFRTTDVGADTFRLGGVDIAASAAFKAVINSVDNDVATVFTTVFGQAGTTVQWRPPNKDYAADTWAGSAGFDGFEVLVTNLDTSESADFYVTLYYED